MGESPNHVRRSACRCGPPPERCLPDDEELVQHGWRDSRYRNQPRIDREPGLSVLRGPISIETATRYVLRWEEPTEQQLNRSRLRRTTAGALRAAGFAVVHTPGRARENACSRSSAADRTRARDSRPLSPRLMRLPTSSSKPSHSLPGSSGGGSKPGRESRPRPFGLIQGGNHRITRSGRRPQPRVHRLFPMTGVMAGR